MQKIVIDTNVLVSSLIQRSYPFLILDALFINDKIVICISDELMNEYYEVLHRPKFSKFHDFLLKAEQLLADIEEKSIKFVPQIKIDLISDKDDNKILELADECKADFIITGNSTDFTFSKYNETKIVSPAEYWEIHKPNL